MIYLFCSAAAPLYKRDALRSVAYPTGHIFRFRYSRRYVDANVLDNLGDHRNAEGILVYADTVGENGNADFAFYPLRKVRLIRLVQSAGAIYVDFRFGDFVNYGSNTNGKSVWDRFLKELPKRPWPPSPKSSSKKNEEGYFLLSAHGEFPNVATDSPPQSECWNSVVNQLDRSENLAKSTFCLLVGFYRVERNLWGNHSEVKLDVVDNTFDSIYPVPMGENVVLKLLLSRPTFDYSDPKSPRTLSITASGDAFSSISKDTIHSESRYDEDRIVLVCKRVFDSVLSVVTIEEPNDVEARSPRLTLLTKVRVPTWVIGTVVGGVAIGALLLAMDADFFKLAATFLDDPWKSRLDSNAKAVAALTKLLAAAPVALSAFLAFKRLPIK